MKKINNCSENIKKKNKVKILTSWIIVSEILTTKSEEGIPSDEKRSRTLQVIFSVMFVLLILATFFSFSNSNHLDFVTFKCKSDW